MKQQRLLQPSSPIVPISHQKHVFGEHTLHDLLLNNSGSNLTLSLWSNLKCILETTHKTTPKTSEVEPALTTLAVHSIRTTAFA